MNAYRAPRRGMTWLFRLLRFFRRRPPPRASLIAWHILETSFPPRIER